MQICTHMHTCTHIQAHTYTCTHAHRHSERTGMGQAWVIAGNSDGRRKRQGNADKCKIISLEPVNQERRRAHIKYRSHESLLPGKGFRGYYKKKKKQVSAPCTAEVIRGGNQGFLCSACALLPQDGRPLKAGACVLNWA